MSHLESFKLGCELPTAPQLKNNVIKWKGEDVLDFRRQRPTAAEIIALCSILQGSESVIGVELAPSALADVAMMADASEGATAEGSPLTAPTVVEVAEALVRSFGEVLSSGGALQRFGIVDFR